MWVTLVAVLIQAVTGSFPLFMINFGHHDQIQANYDKILQMGFRPLLKIIRFLHHQTRFYHGYNLKLLV